MQYKLLITPLFLALAYINFVIPSPLCIIPGPYGFLASMWFMYLVMAIAHCGSWFSLIATLKREDKAAQNS